MLLFSSISGDGEKEEEGSTACRLNTDHAKILSKNYWNKKWD